MTIARASAQTLSTLRARVRNEIGDRSTYPDGTSIPTANLRFLDAQLDAALTDTVIEMQNTMSGGNPGDALVHVDFSYSGLSQDLPSGVNAEGVYKVEDITDSNAPIDIPYSPLKEMHLYSFGTAVATSRYHYTLISDLTSTTGYQIMIKPQPAAARSCRLWYLAAPFVWSPEDGTANDAHPLSARWRETLILGATRKLLRRDNEISDQQETQYQTLWQQFLAFSSRQKGTQRITRKRRGVA